MARRLTAAAEEADVVDLTQDGRGIARVGGKAVFIEDCLPGERVRYRVIKRRAQFDEAALVQVLLPSPERVEPRCAHFGVCGGCSLQHLEPAAQLRYKERQLLEALWRIGAVRPREVLPALPGPAWAYRRRARLGVKFVRKKRRVLAGFRERAHPYLADLERCEILVEPLQSLPQQIAELVDRLDIREMIPQVEIAAGDRITALVFRVMSPPEEADRGRLIEFGRRLGVQIHLQTGGIDTIAPLEPPAQPLEYRIPGADVSIRFAPADFIQVNAAVNAAMVEAALAQLAPRPTDTVLDLFCGLGNFTLPLARRAGRVLGIEADAALIRGARRNAEINGLTNIEFRTEDLFASGNFGGWDGDSYDLVLLDPPRAGAEAVLARLVNWRPRRVVYISCHPASLARDAGAMHQRHGYDLIAAGVMDMFAHTSHVESIAVFQRRP